MRITVVLGAFFPVPPVAGGAVEKVWFALAREFARRGHEVVQISRSFPGFPRREKLDGVEHIRVSGFAQPGNRLWLKLLDLIYSFRVRRILPPADILVTNTFWLPVLVRTENRGRLYLHVQRGPKGQMRWYGHAARLLAVSRAIADAIVAEAPGLKEKVRVIPNSLPFPLPQPQTSARDRTVLFVGRIHPEKGLDLLLRAVGKIPAETRADWKLKIVGPHETRFGGGGDAFAKGLRSLAQDLELKTEWVGPVFDESELLRHYQEAAVFVYPSVAETGEALPVAPLEAMANGCVPVVSGLACFEDYIEDKVTGFVFDHRGPSAETTLAERLSAIFQMIPAELTAIGNAARERVAQFAVEPVADRYLADFASLLVKDQT
ncbi:MAG TPA: glycosyltransferase family 4 protein [Chthoniobacterales bacterium]|jgi:glycosyltransferase involved in cell wall biosynthesis|nr:glycosyltransferase family 4 protein [Chthoniobacterales bacterium]